MSDADLLIIVKLSLAVNSSAFDEYLLSLIQASREMISREGIDLADTPEDNNLIVMYTAYLWRKRADDNPVMPRMLRYAMNNRLFSQQAGGSENAV